MKPTKMLIAALYSAADRLEAKDCEYHGDYRWMSAERCNCGILAQELLQIDGDALKELLIGQGALSAYTHSAKCPDHFCQVTGLPISNIFKLLYVHGLEKEDYNMIENCVKNGEYGDYMNPISVAKYFRELAVKLEKERKK